LSGSIPRPSMCAGTPPRRCLPTRPCKKSRPSNTKGYSPSPASSPAGQGSTWAALSPGWRHGYTNRSFPIHRARRIRTKCSRRGRLRCPFPMSGRHWCRRAGFAISSTKPWWWISPRRSAYSPPWRGCGRASWAWVIIITPRLPGGLATPAAWTACAGRRPRPWPGQTPRPACCSPERTWTIWSWLKNRFATSPCMPWSLRVSKPMPCAWPRTAATSTSPAPSISSCSPTPD